MVPRRPKYFYKRVSLLLIFRSHGCTYVQGSIAPASDQGRAKVGCTVDETLQELVIFSIDAELVEIVLL